MSESIQPVPDPPERPGGIGKGLLLGLLWHVLALLVALLSIRLFSEVGVMSVLSPFILIIIIHVVMMSIPGDPRRRRVAAGVLIIAAAVWLILIGPCTLLVLSI